jgi:LysM repeat protein
MRCRIIIATFAAAAALAPILPALADDPHYVRPGETLSSIAAAHGTTLGTLISLNDIRNPNLISAGSYVRIGAPQLGGPPVSFLDYGSDVARRHGLDNRTQVAANFIRNEGSFLTAAQQVWAAESNPETQASLSTVVRGPVITRDAAQRALDQAAREYAIDPRLVYSLAWLESGWQQHVVSHAGAVGLMQLMPDTAEWVMNHVMGQRMDWRGSEVANARVGVAYLHYLLMRTDHDGRNAIGSYYQGLGSVRRWGRFTETDRYVDLLFGLMRSNYWDRFGAVPW